MTIQENKKVVWLKIQIIDCSCKFKRSGWLKAAVSKGDFLSELFKYKFNYHVWERDCTRIYAEKWLKDILLWGKCQLQANVSVHKFLNSD